MTESIRGQHPQEDEDVLLAAQAASEPDTSDPDDAADPEEQEETPTAFQQTSAEEAPADGSEPSPAEAPAPKKRSASVWIAAAAAVVLLAVIVLLTVKILRDRKPAPAEPVQTAETHAPAETPADEQPASDAQTAEVAQPAGNGVSYTVEPEALTDEVLAQRVASCGSDALTNRELPIYYWQQYYTFANTYGSYLAYILDPAAGLDQQMFDAESTWQQMFLRTGVQMYDAMAALCQEADSKGFTLSDTAQAQLDDLKTDLTASAMSYGYKDADEYVQKIYGPSVRYEDYAEFIRRNFLATEYLNSLAEQIPCTEQDVLDHYARHEEEFTASGLTRDDTPMVNVRHILIIPDETAEDGTYTDAAWQEAERQAQALLDEWLAGDSTEEGFAALAAAHTEDPGSAQTGGLYEEVYPGQMVQPFNDWCFDAARAEGDYGIVRTDYGYHVMYFSSFCPTSYWYRQIEQDYLSEATYTLEETIVARYDCGVTYENAAIVDVLSSMYQ